MNVEARSQLMKQVLNKGKFIIPEYQREYDWTDENLNLFLEDINESDDEENYFIGHMVCEGDYNGTEFNVIDGQQRITTITIMLSALRDAFYEKGLDKFANGINNKYIFSTDVEENEFVVLENQMPYPTLQTYVQSVPKKKVKNIEPKKSGEKKIVYAYDKFFDIFKKLDEDNLKILRDKLLNLEVIFVAVDDEVDAFTIFETLNAKGKDLTPLDMIKNQIFKSYVRQTHLDEPNDSWKLIINNIENNSLKFLNNFWASRYKKVSDKKIYKEFIKESKKNTFDYNNFVSDLLYDSILFNKIINPKKSDWNKDEFSIFISLHAISIFNVRVANAMILSILREYSKKNISLKYCEKALSSLEKFHFLNNAICSLRSSGLDTMYSRISRELYDSKDKHERHNCIDKMIKDLEIKKPEIEKVKASIDDKLYFTKENKQGEKQKKLVKYVLEKIEFSKHTSSIDYLDTSIEHIYPEKAKKVNWPSTIKKDLIKNISNLTLLDRTLNSEVGDKSYSNKKKIILEKSNLLATKEFFNQYNKWTEEELILRKENLIDKIYNGIW